MGNIALGGINAGSPTCRLKREVLCHGLGNGTVEQEGPIAKQNGIRLIREIGRKTGRLLRPLGPLFPQKCRPLEHAVHLRHRVLLPRQLQSDQ